MAAMGPAKILKFWNKVADKYGVEEEKEDKKGKDKGDKGKDDKKKKPSAKDKAIVTQQERITKALTRLRNTAQGGVKTEDQVKNFTNVQTKAVMALKKFCKSIKGYAPEGAGDIGKLRKVAKQITVTVSNLTVSAAQNEEEGEVDLNALDSVDVAALDKEMENPNFGEYSDAEIDDDSIPIAPPLQTGKPEKKEPDQTPPKVEKEEEQAEKEEEEEGDKKDDAAATWNARYKKLEPLVLQALKDKKGDVSKIRSTFAFAVDQGTNKDYAKGLTAFDNLQKLLDAANGIPEAPPLPPAGEKPQSFEEKFTARFKALLPKLDEAQKAGGPNALDFKLLKSEAGVFARKRDFVAGNEVLDRAEALLKQAAGGDANGKDLAGAQASWQTARNTAVAELRKIAADLSKEPSADTREALILINALIKNLTPKLDTPQQVKEMERFIGDDDVIADACIAHDIRTPLMQAISSMKTALSL